MRNYNEYELNVYKPTLENAIVHQYALQICNEYNKSAHYMMKQLEVKNMDGSLEDILIQSCVEDLRITGDRRVRGSYFCSHSKKAVVRVIRE